METIATGGGGKEKINLLIIHLVSHECVDVEKARIMFINSSLELLEMINNKCELAPYVEKFPFEYYNVDLHLSFLDDSWQEMNIDFIAYVTLIDKKLYYLVYDKKEAMPKLVHKEDYEEALKIVKSTSNCVLIDRT